MENNQGSSLPAGQKEVRRIIVQIGPREVDMTEPPPITGGDRVNLFRGGVDLRKFGSEDGLNPEEESKLLLYLVKRIDKEATEAEVNALASHVQSSMLDHFLRKTRDSYNPFRPPSSTSSPPSTAGAEKS